MTTTRLFIAILGVLIVSCAPRQVQTTPGGTSTTTNPGIPLTTTNPGIPPTTTIPGDTSTATSPGIPPTTANPGIPPTTANPGIPPTTTNPGVPPTTTIPGDTSPTTSPGIPPTTVNPGIPPTTTNPGIPPTTTIPGGSSTTGKPPIPCTMDNDILALLDSSASITPANFDVAKQFLSTFSKEYKKHYYNRLGVTQYGSTVRVELSITNALSLEGHAVRIPTIERIPPEGKTNTTGALTVAIRPLQRVSQVPPIPQYILVLTDGNSDDDISAPLAEAKKAGITIIAVGIGDKVKYSRLLELVGNDPARIYNVTS